ncbi:MAG: SPFH/Band 7/PHB domain protein [Gammaproteobacteria bacterium]|nr:SPFH/Band 7/PHB domain protein [Gammaproteobacteria bacterium]
MESTLIAFAVFIIILVTIAKAVRTVPQGEEWVVERLGKFNATLTAGLRFLIPYIDRVAYRVPTKDLILDIPEQEVITRDNVVIITNAIAFVKVTDTVKAVYGITDFRVGVSNITQTTLRAIIGEMDLDNALSSRDRIKVRLKESISDDVADWGLTVKSVEIQDIKPSATMQTSMEKQAAAERERKAAVIKAEGEKQAAILQAEARLEAAKRDAAAQITLASGASEAIKKVTDAISDRDLPAYFLLGERYITAIKDLAASPGSKTVLFPADLIQAIQGLMGRSRP